VLFLFLFLLPIVLAIMNEWMMIFLAYSCLAVCRYYWLVHYGQPKTLLNARHFYYNLARIKHLFTEKHAAQESCFLLPLQISRFKTLSFGAFKTKGHPVQIRGVRANHHVNYINRYVTLPFLDRTRLYHTYQPMQHLKLSVSYPAPVS